MYNEGIFEEMLLHLCYHAFVITNHYFPAFDDPVQYLPTSCVDLEHTVNICR